MVIYLRHSWWDPRNICRASKKSSQFLRNYLHLLDDVIWWNVLELLQPSCHHESILELPRTSLQRLRMKSTLSGETERRKPSPNDIICTAGLGFLKPTLTLDLWVTMYRRLWLCCLSGFKLDFLSLVMQSALTDRVSHEVKVLQDLEECQCWSSQFYDGQVICLH